MVKKIQGGSQEMAVMVKIFNNDNSGEFCAKTKRHQIHLKKLSLLKFLPLTYHHSHFLAATLDFTSFFTIAFLGAALFFTAWLFNNKIIIVVFIS